jgi:hypothetical protein
MNIEISQIESYFNSIAESLALACTTLANSEWGAKHKSNAVYAEEISVEYIKHDPYYGDDPAPWIVEIPVKVNPRRKASGWMRARGTGATPKKAADDALRAYTGHHEVV